MCRTIEKKYATNGGRSGAPRALQCNTVSFFNCTTHREKSQDTQQKSSRYSAKSTLLSQKQRRYAYDSRVYDKPFTRALEISQL